MYNWKLILPIASILIAVTFYFIEETPSTSSIETASNINANTSTQNSSQTISEYKELFTESEIVSEMQKIEDQQDLTKVDDDAESLIAQADRLIEENNLVLPTKELTEEENIKMQEFNEKLAQAQQELEELSYEN